MKITNSQVYDIYKIMGCNYASMARQLTETYGNFLGDIESIKAKARRAFQKRPHKKNLLSLWNQKVMFEEAVAVEEVKPAAVGETHPLDHGGIRNKAGRPKMRLSERPGKRTIQAIMKPRMDELVQFADDQGIDYDEVIELLEDRKKKKQKRCLVEIPVEDAVALYFNQEHSSRSWTELRLFLEEYDVRLPTRNEVDCMKKEMLPGGITCNEVKSDVNFDDLVSNTARGLVQLQLYNVHFLPGLLSSA